MQIKAHAKVNIYLKITGHKDGYHTLDSRFMRVENLYDIIEFVECKCDSFTIEGCDGVDLKSNTIYKAYKALNEYTGDLDILDFFYNHKVVVTKNIPSQAGLGGGSSDAGAFMRLVKDVCNLLISDQELAQIGSSIGADVPFFVHNYPSANISGFGEIVQPFDEEPLDLEIYTPPIGCDTAKVYQRFKKDLFETIDTASFASWHTQSSHHLLQQYDAITLNDLYKAALLEYPNLKEYAKDGWYFSGSGSSFFRVMN
jgi:4-diphosphocytidyl-2-C-methyl-D-erythritol kinase